MEDRGYANGMVRLLLPCERLLAVAQAKIAEGVAPPEPPDAEKSELISPIFWPLEWISTAAHWLTDLIFWGFAGRGKPGSHASRMNYAGCRWTVLDGHRNSVLAVTDQRVLLCVTGPMKSWSSRDDEQAIAEMEAVWTAPREVVARARVGWHRLNPKCLQIFFTDESWLAFTVALAESGRPLRAVAAALDALEAVTDPTPDQQAARPQNEDIR